MCTSEIVWSEILSLPKEVFVSLSMKCSLWQVINRTEYKSPYRQHSSHNQISEVWTENKKRGDTTLYNSKHVLFRFHTQCDRSKHIWNTHHPYEILLRVLFCKFHSMPFWYWKYYWMQVWILGIYTKTGISCLNQVKWTGVRSNLTYLVSTHIVLEPSFWR